MRHSSTVLLVLGAFLLALSPQLVAAPVPPETLRKANADDLPLPPGAIARLGSARLHHWGLITVAFLGDGKCLSAGSDGSFRVWDPATGREVRRFGTPGFSPEAVAISPDGKSAASSYSDPRMMPVRLWDVATGKGRPGPAPAGRPAPPGQYTTRLAFSPDSKILATATRRKGIGLWDVATGKLVAQFGHKWIVSSSLVFSPDGRWLVSMENDGTIYIWKVATGDRVHVLRVSPRGLGVAFAPDGKTFASSDGNGVALWKTESGERRWRSQELQKPIHSLGFTPDGKTLMAWDFAGTGRAWDVASGREVQRMAAFMKGTTALVFSPDRKLIAGLAGQRLRLWDVATGRELYPEQGSQTEVLALAFSPDQRLLASVGRDRVIRLWDVRRRKVLRSLEGHTWEVIALAFSPDGKTLASTSAIPKDALILWEVSTGKRLLTVSSNYIAGFVSVAFSGDGKRVAIGCCDKSVRLRDLATGKELGVFPFRGRTPRHVFFSADEQSLTAIDFGPSFSTWSVLSGGERLSARNKAGYGSAVSADGRNLTGADTEHVYVWEMATGKERVRIPHGEKEKIGALAFSPDGKLLIGALFSQALSVWDPLSGREVGRVSGLSSMPDVLVFTPDGKTLASGFRDGTILLWDVTRLPKPKQAAPRELSAMELKAQWQALQGEDTARAYRALTLLRLTPRQALPLLRQDLRPATPPDAKRIAQLVKNLDSKSFAAREKATAELGRLGQQAEAALGKALEGNPSDEMRKRIKQLLEAAPPSTERVRSLRMLELLEHIGTPEARQVLKTLADNKSDAWLAAEARAAEARLHQRDRPKP